MNFDSVMEFQKCQKNENESMINYVSTINFERFDVNICPKIKEAIENNYLPRTIEVLMKNQFEYKYEEKKN